MKKSELKNMIKECVKEVLFEEGVLSSIIAEVTYGLTSAQNLLSEKKERHKKVAHQTKQKDTTRETKKKLQETKRKMLDAIGNQSMQGIFEGTEPLRGTPGDGQAHSPLSGVDPSDSGVDISGILGVVGDSWKRLK